MGSIFSYEKKEYDQFEDNGVIYESDSSDELTLNDLYILNLLVQIDTDVYE
tara:strand:- start:21146 stop:21298 length:153 start_codon:yes stop_codon:yes gene_type:complete